MVFPDTLALALVVLVIEALAGYPDRVYRVIGHPVTWIGTLIGWLESEPWPPWYAGMVLMFQKEVAERIVAEPNSKAYGRLAVISQWRTEPRMLFKLPPGAFSPPPKIESAVVGFTPRPHPQPECDVTILGQVTAAAFGQRRKMLRQSLKSLRLDPTALLDIAGIDGTRRGETLSIADFARLAAIHDMARKQAFNIAAGIRRRDIEAQAFEHFGDQPAHHRNHLLSFSFVIRMSGLKLGIWRRLPSSSTTRFG